MVTVDQLKGRQNLLLIISKTSQFLMAGLFIYALLVLPIIAKHRGQLDNLSKAQKEFYNGNFSAALEKAKVGINQAKKKKHNDAIIFQLRDILVSSQIFLGKYKEADETLALLQSTNLTREQKALVNLRLAWLLRMQNQYKESFEISKKALELLPDSNQIKGEYYLNIGRILFSSGYDVSAIIWLEKAEKALEKENITSAKLDTNKFLSLAWSAKLNYQTSLKYAEKWAVQAENTQFKFHHRQALFELANILSITNQKQKAFVALEKGLGLSLRANNTYQSSNFLSSLVLNSLFIEDIDKASNYLRKLEEVDSNNQFAFEILLGKAIISAYIGQHEISEKLFSDLDKMESYSEFILPIWKLTIAEKNQNWKKFLQINHNLFDLITKSNFRDDLPGVYLDFSKAYYHLGQPQKSLENLEKSLSFIEEIRKSENNRLSLGLFETYHSAYRLLAQLKSGNVQKSFELADFLKARFLEGRINNSIFRHKPVVSVSTRRMLEDLSLKFIDDPGFAKEIEKYEKLVANSIPELALNTPDLTELNDFPDLNDTVIVSYFFTLDKKLLAYVWEQGQPLKMIDLAVSQNEIEVYAETTHRKIKNFIFFKRDGKDLYDKLLKPLSLKAKHLIIIPDKSLWKIPFQALSPDGKNYLIEEKLISYSPSISILLDQFKKPKPNRQSFQAFANSTFENKSLQYVNSEAKGVANIYNAKPILNATIADFEKFSGKSDINHFSMHAQVANEQPLESFLAFRKNEKGDGRLTVEEILDIKLKQGSLAFLASCDTTNVLNGEGLVSLSWAMMASGATTVISAQWEANDKSAEVFTKSFYENYKKGNSSAEALQKASLELIQNKSKNMHEPYYWAEFTLNGDFR